MKRSNNFVMTVENKNSNEVKALKKIVSDANKVFIKIGFDNRVRVSIKGRLGKNSEFKKFYGYKNWRKRYEELSSGEFVPANQDIVSQMIDEGYHSSYMSVPHSHAAYFDIYIHQVDSYGENEKSISFERVDEIISNLKAKYEEMEK